jgi:tRNA-uridine 2-sulfurtransferase
LVTTKEQSNTKNKKVAIAISGGVDSSVAAALLKKNGYDVVGLTMHLWDYDSVGGNVFSESSCCSVETVNDARTVCLNLDIPHYVIDVRETFEKFVVANFSQEYLNGRTPNPCILCNSEMKWKILLEKTNELGYEYFSTGHYARVELDEKSGRFLLLRGIDSTKDQAYALWRLTQSQLQRTLFPLGNYCKTEIRKIATELNLKTKDKKESQEICFVPDEDYTRFLDDRHPGLKEKLAGGEILDQQNNVLGTHKGFPFYTIGQRKGLGIAVGKPVYVTKIDAKSNRVFVGDKEDLFSKGLIAGEINWIAIEKLEKPKKVNVKIRYNDTGKPATILPHNDRVKVVFDNYHEAVTPGQSVVFFEGEVVVGGGVIEREVEYK